VASRYNIIRVRPLPRPLSAGEGSPADEHTISKWRVSPSPAERGPGGEVKTEKPLRLQRFSGYYNGDQ